MQIYRIIPTRRSDRDLDEIAQYIFENAPASVDRVIDQILKQINSLRQMPQRFIQVGVSRRLATPVHRLVVEPYLIYYRIDADAVYILTVRHGARQELKRFD